VKNILELKDFSVSLKNNNRKILNNINIEIKEKGFLGIVGESGSGKTTLLNSIISFLDEKKFVLNGKMIFLKI
jgi:oligopeptide transport ATP-binding protein OppD